MWRNYRIDEEKEESIVENQDNESALDSKEVQENIRFNKGMIEKSTLAHKMGNEIIWLEENVLGITTGQEFDKFMCGRKDHKEKIDSNKLIGKSPNKDVGIRVVVMKINVIVETDDRNRKLLENVLHLDGRKVVNMDDGSKIVEVEKNVGKVEIDIFSKLW